jgi:hypothetical protein
LGKSTLTLLGYPLTVDATANNDLLIIPVNNFPPSHTGKADMVLLPLKASRDTPCNSQPGLVSKLSFNGGGKRKNQF